MQNSSEKVQYIGCEIHKASIASTLKTFEMHCENNKIDGINNVLLLRVDVGLLLLNNNYLPDECLDEVCVYFPDPWPATRDEGRRVIRNDILEALSKKLKRNGLIRIATDVDAYADHVRNVISKFNNDSTLRGGYQFHNLRDESHSPCEDVPYYRSITRYERKARDKMKEKKDGGGIITIKVHEIEYQIEKAFKDDDISS
jgi:tRNA (guanine-N7-)-methyltransferase